MIGAVVLLLLGGLLAALVYYLLRPALLKHVVLSNVQGHAVFVTGISVLFSKTFCHCVPVNKG